MSLVRVWSSARIAMEHDNLDTLKLQKPVAAQKAFKSYEPIYVHVDVKYLPQMQDESSWRYLIMAIDRAMR